MTTFEPTTGHSAPRPPAPKNPHDDPQRTEGGWTTGRTIALLVALTALAGAATMLLAGGIVLALDNAWREDGYLTSDEIPLSSPGYAVAADRIDLDGIEPLWPEPDGLLGKVRIRVTNLDHSQPVFVGVARADRVDTYLSGVDHSTLTEIADPATEYVHHRGNAPGQDPSDTDIWKAEASGVGTQTLDWPLTDGVWTVVVMNADGSPGVKVSADVGASVPINRPVGIGLLVSGALLGSAASAVVWTTVRRTRHLARTGDQRRPR
jgi:hypothetical protein